MVCWILKTHRYLHFQQRHCSKADMLAESHIFLQSEEDSSKDIDEASSGGSGSDSDVSVVSDDDVPSSRIKELVSNDKHSSKRKRL